MVYRFYTAHSQFYISTHRALDYFSSAWYSCQPVCNHFFCYAYHRFLPEDVSFFVKCNIEPFLAQCKNIFDCGLGHFRIASFQSDSQYYYITFQRSVSFFRYIDNTAVGETHLVELELIKKINASFKSDYIMSRCPSLLCNEPFDWLSGQTCPNCGEKPAYEEYDWAVTNARIIPFKNKQEQNMWF